jgi:uncharacterized membrane protein YeaQ/YmgE (transglycosylase-associated protein family)
MTDDAVLHDQLRTELYAMTRHALADGMPMPGGVVEGLTAEDDERGIAWLVDAHRRMAAVVAPATPGSLALLDSERDVPGLWGVLGPVRLVRLLLVGSGVFLAVFIAASLSPAVHVGSGDIFTSSGPTLLINEVFLLAAAGMGASFAALFRVNRYIANGTFDQTYEASYLVQVVLGLIAGMVLSSLIPAEGSGTFSDRALLALLGGFSASVVHRVLVRLVDTVESLVAGETAVPPQPRAVGPAPPSIE